MYGNVTVMMIVVMTPMNQPTVSSLNVDQGTSNVLPLEDAYLNPGGVMVILIVEQMILLMSLHNVVGTEV